MENTDFIPATALKGFSSITSCWQFLHDIASQLEQTHANGHGHGNINLRHIAVEGNHFKLMDHEGKSDCKPCNDIWSLAASAFELILGSPILNGADESAQKEKTPLPSLPHDEADSLNKLLHQCMRYQDEERPTATHVKETASKALAQSKQSRATRIQTTINTQESIERTDRLWPEDMIMSAGRRLVIVILMLLSVTTAIAQSALSAQDEAVTQKLIEAVLMLRNPDRKSWDAAQDELKKRISQVTLMNELQDKDNDCVLINTQTKSTGVNRIVNELKKGKRVQYSGKGLLDGADLRFNYSIYEKGVKAGHTSTYTLTGRWGKQVFAIVPYSASQQYSTELIKANGTVVPVTTKDAKGITYYCIDAANGPREGEKLSLRITNKDSKNNASFVVINHNYRNK